MVIDESVKTFTSEKDIKTKVKDALSLVERQGMKELIAFLDTTDYYTAPASTRFHLSSEGGLLQHHYNVYWFLYQVQRVYKMGLPRDSIIVTSLLHDLCKVGLYRKDDAGNYQYNKEVIQRGHAKLSIERIKAFIGLTEEEEAMIKYHMGLYGVYGIGGGEYTAQELHDAINKFKSVQIFASVDMGSSIYEGAKEKQAKEKVKVHPTKKGVLEIIMEQGKDKGIEIEEVLSHFLEEDKAEYIIQHLMREGEIFEVKKGRIKPLL